MNLEPYIYQLNLPQAIGLLAYFIGITAFLQKKDNHLKLHLGLSSLVIAIHYLLLGQQPAALSCMISTIRSWISIYFKKTWVALFFLCLIWVLGIPTIDTPIQWLTIIGTSSGTLGLFFFSGYKLRICLLVGSLLWSIHNYFIQSIGGFLQEGTFVLINAYVLIKDLSFFLKNKKNAC